VEISLDTRHDGIHSHRGVPQMFEQHVRFGVRFAPVALDKQREQSGRLVQRTQQIVAGAGRKPGQFFQESLAPGEFRRGGQPRMACGARSVALSIPARMALTEVGQCRGQ